MRRLKSDFEGFGWQCTISGLHVESNNRINTAALVEGGGLGTHPILRVIPHPMKSVSYCGSGMWCTRK